MNSTLFPRLFNISFDQTFPYWPESVDISNVDSMNECFGWFQIECSETEGDVELMQEKASAFFNDLEDIKQNHPDHRETLDFMQFLIATFILKEVTARKIFPYSFDWIANSMNIEISKEKQRELGFDKVINFLISENPFVAENMSFAFSGLIHDLFYYSRSSGGHKESARVFVEDYLDTFCKAIETTHEKEGVKALIQIVSWCHQLQMKEGEKMASESLGRLYQVIADNEVRKNISLHFCVADKSYTGISKMQWCNIVKQEYNGQLRGHEPLQLLVNLYQHDLTLLIEHFEEIVSTTKAYRESWGDQRSLPLLVNHHMVRIYSILEKTIVTLLLGCEIVKANRLIGAYFGIPDNELIPGTNCYIIPNHPNGVAFCLESNVTWVAANAFDEIPKITSLSNKFLGATHMFTNLMDFPVDVPEREGVPDPNAAPKLEEALRSYFQFKEMLKVPHFDRCTGYYLSYGTQMAIQNIMALEIGFTLPLIHSFQAPLKKRTIREVYIWEGETILAEYERLGLEELFSFFNIKVAYSSHHTAKQTDFLHNYSNPKYDLVWIICHGQYFHHEAHTSHLVLGSGFNLNIQDMPNAPTQDEGRRLLFIDACDGATTSLSNSPQSIGIGPAMIDRHQSLLSHGWPVDNHSSMIMGFLTAYFLCQGISYSEAHYNSIMTFRKGKDLIIQLLSQCIKNEDLLDRIRNKDLTFDNFVYWGSPIYME